MPLLSLTDKIITAIVDFLPQSDVCSLCLTSKRLHSIGVNKLYKSICIRKDPSIKSNHWFIDSIYSEVAGPRLLHKRSDQNDYLIYLKLENLKSSLEKYGDRALKVDIYPGVFSDEHGVDYLNSFVDSLGKHATNLESLRVFEPKVKSFIKNNMKTLLTNDFESLNMLDDPQALILKLHRYSEKHCLPDLEKIGQLKDLTLDDEENSALRILKTLSDQGLPKLKLKRLCFNHVHGMRDYNTVLRSLTTEFIDSCVDLENLEELEMTIGCEEKDCECLSAFLDDLSKKLKSIKKLALCERTYLRDHYLTEDWDVSVGRFVIALNDKLRFLSIRHNPPVDGKLKNGLEGNALRRRILFQRILPELTSLETFISPTFLQSCACYEILVSDLLWNGCECDFCKEFLPYYDKYLMDHAYYDEESADFKDMISPRLFGLFGSELMKRLPNQGDLDTMSLPPSDNIWGFHGYDTITCFNDVNECVFDEKFFEPLAVCCAHFMTDPPIQVMAESVPSLRRVVLSGIYFTVNRSGKIECVYDTPEIIK